MTTMEQKKNSSKAAAQTIAAGQRISIEGKTRKEVADKLRELRAKALSAGLISSDGGAIFFHKEDYLDEGKFVSIITFKN